MTLPVGALNLQQVATEMSIVSPPITMDRLDIRALGNAALTPSSPVYMAAFQGKTCDTHVMLVGQAFGSQPGFLDGSYGGMNDPNFRGVRIVQCSYSGSGIFQFGLDSIGVPNNYFSHILIWPDQNANQPPMTALASVNASVFHIGSQKFWNWNSGVNPALPSWGNNWNVRVQLLY
jgi:hypothetical protein